VAHSIPHRDHRIRDCLQAARGQSLGVGLANGLLHGFWHVHQPWGIGASAIASVFLYAFPAWRFRSTWMGVIVHSAQSVYFAFLILGVVLGLA